MVSNSSFGGTGGGSEGRAVQSPSGAGHLRRSRVILATVLVLIGLCAVACYVAAATGIGICGGDGGSPYAAPASPRGKYCESGLPWISLLVGLALPVAGGVAVAVRHRWLPLVMCAVVGTVLVLSPLVVGSALSKECADAPKTGPYDRDREERPECAHY